MSSDLEDLIDSAHRDPAQIRHAVESAYAIGRARPTTPELVSALANKLRRKANITQEYDGRSALYEMADELDGGALHLGRNGMSQQTATGASSGPKSSSQSKEGSDQQ